MDRILPRKHEHDQDVDGPQYTSETVIICEAGLFWRRMLCRLECRVNAVAAQGYREVSRERVHEDGTFLLPKLRRGYIVTLQKVRT